MTVAQYGLRGVGVTLGAIGLLQGIGVVIRSKPPISAKTQALATALGILVFNILVLPWTAPETGHPPGAYFAGFVIYLVTIGMGVRIGNNKLDGRNDLNIYYQGTVAVAAHFIMAIFLDVLINSANTNAK